MMPSVQIGHVTNLPLKVFSDRIVYSPEKLLYGFFVIANFIQSPFMSNVVKYGRESICLSSDEISFFRCWYTDEGSGKRLYILI